MPFMKSLANFLWLTYNLLDVAGSSVHQLISQRGSTVSRFPKGSKFPTERASCYGILVRNLLCLHFLRRSSVASNAIRIDNGGL